MFRSQESNPRKLLILVQDGPQLGTTIRHRKGKGTTGEKGGPTWKEPTSKLLEGAATALGSLMVLGLAGYSYHEYYKSLTLRKLENAFAPGYSTLELAALGRRVSFNDYLEGLDVDDDDWIFRPEQATINGIVDGSIRGQYHLITGEKGTGKTSMLLKAMSLIDGEGIAMLEAHGDLEIFRIRLGKALDYEFHEDYIGSLFSFKGPRDTTPLLDIERAFNKMEKVALQRQQKTGRPLVLIINGAHLLQDNDEGRHLLELIQQRAEIWAASNLVTVVFNSDEYWIFERLMRQATRLRVLPVHDIPKATAIPALKSFRAKHFNEELSPEMLEHVYSKVGGRLRFLTRVAKSSNMERVCKTICDEEKRWFLNQCWILGKDMDPAAEEHQDFCSAAMILAKELVAREEALMASGNPESRLPQMPLHEARQLVTRFDFLQHHDRINIFTIDSKSMVQADSVAMQNAFRDVCKQEGFEELLEETMERLDQLESLARTREITVKDLWGEGKYQAVVENGGPKGMVVSLRAIPPKGEDE